MFDDEILEALIVQVTLHQALVSEQWERRNSGSRLSCGTEATGAPAHSAASQSSKRASPQWVRHRYGDPDRNSTSPCRCWSHESLVISVSITTLSPLHGDTRRRALAPKRTRQRLETYEHRYRELAAELADIGYIASGSLASRFTRCGKPHCAYTADPPKLHGPYWHWSTKVDGKTVNRRLNDREAALYSEWIDNDRRARELLAKMQRSPPRQPQSSFKKTPYEGAQGSSGSGSRRMVTIHRSSGGLGFDPECTQHPTTKWRTPLSCAHSSLKCLMSSGLRQNP